MSLPRCEISVWRDPPAVTADQVYAGGQVIQAKDLGRRVHVAKRKRENGSSDSATIDLQNVTLGMAGTAAGLKLIWLLCGQIEDGPGDGLVFEPSEIAGPFRGPVFLAPQALHEDNPWRRPYRRRCRYVRHG
jgi:hypothetical protein